MNLLEEVNWNYTLISFSTRFEQNKFEKFYFYTQTKKAKHEASN